MNQGTYLQITLVEGKQGPFYPDRKQLEIEEAVITEQGTTKGLPIVDLVCHDADGNKFILVFTGRILISLAAAIKAVNERNHGVSEP